MILSGITGLVWYTYEKKLWLWKKRWSWHHSSPCLHACSLMAQIPGTTPMIKANILWLPWAPHTQSLTMTTQMTTSLVVHTQSLQIRQIPLPGIRWAWHTLYPTGRLLPWRWESSFMNLPQRVTMLTLFQTLSALKSIAGWQSYVPCCWHTCYEMHALIKHIMERSPTFQVLSHKNSLRLPFIIYTETAVLHFHCSSMKHLISFFFLSLKSKWKIFHHCYNLHSPSNLYSFY